MISISSFLPDGFSPSMYHITSFHDSVMIVVIGVTVIVAYVLSQSLLQASFSRFTKSSEVLETVWTVLPCLVLGGLAGPSLVTLYLSDEIEHPSLDVKIIGHQWFWSYEWGKISTLSADSYLTPTEGLGVGEPRLLEADSSLSLPCGVEVRLAVTSSDVIHSWAVPSLGVKVDAIPGRLNQLVVFGSRPGVAYGQCSEICGSLHPFMPINVNFLPLEEVSKLASSG